ncbi:MAG: hypothetical protein JW719_14030 [Pirellulales bacterium]|nr:hypothetical protein [Pirellulales bacterium]
MTHEGSGDQGANQVAQHEHQLYQAAGITSSSTTVQIVAGAAAVVLTILGLAGLNPMYMAAVATLAVASALVVQGITVGTCYSHVVNDAGGMHPIADIRAGLTAEFVAGATCVVLGILALLGIEAPTLTAVSAIVLGSGILLGAGIANRLAHFASDRAAHHPYFKNMITDAVTAAAGAEVLVGGGAIVLGVIALVGSLSYTLTLVALLALGASTLITSTAVAGKIGGVWANN